jgi:hypothetical protein
MIHALKNKKPRHIIMDRAWKSFFTSLYGKDNYSFFFVNQYVDRSVLPFSAKSRDIIPGESPHQGGSGSTGTESHQDIDLPVAIDISGYRSRKRVSD